MGGRLLWRSLEMQGSVVGRPGRHASDVAKDEHGRERRAVWSAGDEAVRISGQSSPPLVALRSNRYGEKGADAS
jgi:hypothetical protein